MDQNQCTGWFLVSFEVPPTGVIVWKQNWLYFFELPSIPEIPIVLGRGSSCDIVLQSVAVSREHARLIRLGQICCIKDTSRFGTHVNSIRIEKDEWFALSDGDCINMAGHHFVLTTRLPSGVPSYSDFRRQPRQIVVAF